MTAVLSLMTAVLSLMTAVLSLMTAARSLMTAVPSLMTAVLSLMTAVLSLMTAVPSLMTAAPSLLTASLAMLTGALRAGMRAPRELDVGGTRVGAVLAVRTVVFNGPGLLLGLAPVALRVELRGLIELSPAWVDTPAGQSARNVVPSRTWSPLL